MENRLTAEEILREQFTEEKINMGVYPDAVLRPRIYKSMREYAAQETAALREENEQLKEVLKAIIPLAEDGHVLHKRNGCHQEFLYEDVERIENAKKLTGQ